MRTKSIASEIKMLAQLVCFLLLYARYVYGSSEEVQAKSNR